MKGAPERVLDRCGRCAHALLDERVVCLGRPAPSPRPDLTPRAHRITPPGHIHEDAEDGRHVMLMKGVPERVLNRCAHASWS